MTADRPMPDTLPESPEPSPAQRRLLEALVTGRALVRTSPLWGSKDRSRWRFERARLGDPKFRLDVLDVCINRGWVEIWRDGMMSEGASITRAGKAALRRAMMEDCSHAD